MRPSSGDSQSSAAGITPSSAGQPVDGVFGRCDDHRLPHRNPLDGFLKERPMRGIRRPQAQIDDRGAASRRFVDAAIERRDVSGQPAPEHLDDDDRAVRRLFANHRGHGGAVAEPIDEILVERPVLSNGDALFDGSHVGMRGMNAAVDDRGADPATRVILQEHVETGDRGPDVSSLGSR
jgi:hypothetical protein